MWIPPRAATPTLPEVPPLRDQVARGSRIVLDPRAQGAYDKGNAVSRRRIGDA